MILSGLFLAVTACGGGEVAPPTTPKSVSLRGYEYKSNVAMNTANELIWAETLLRDYKKNVRRHGQMQLAKLTQARCPLPGVNLDYVTQVVTIEESKLKAPMFIMDEDKVDAGVEQLLKRYRETGKIVDLGPQYARPREVGLVNVVVTETEKPVVLLLSARRYTVWNIHPAEDVSIAKIILVSNNLNGLANVPEGTEIHALYGEEATQRCEVVPARQPAEHWRFTKNSKRSSSASDAYNENVQRGNAFYAWLDRYYDVGKNGTIDAAALSNVLVGPAPEKKVHYQSLENATLHWPRTPHLIFGNPQDMRKLGYRYVVAEAKKQAGGAMGN